MRWDRKDKFELADIGGESDAATHAEGIAGPGAVPSGYPLREAGGSVPRTKKQARMPGHPREMITVAGAFPCPH